MATPNATIPDYCADLLRSKLLTETDIADLRKRWRAEHGKDSDVDGFRKFLVREKFLTEYQAVLIQRGRADGFVIGEYIILDRIGRGQTAGVYKAVHQSGQAVALKVLSGSKARDQHILNRFLREGRLLTQLDHPNVVRAYQVGQSGGVHFIVMEHVDGETLDEVLDRRKRLTVPEAARLVQQAFQGLQHLHERRMVHRDLKPANLMLSPGGKPDTLDSTLRILDIGLGRELFDDDAPSTQDIQLTGEGALLGTPDYLAPEQARDARSADIRADIYSLGCVLYQLLAGHPPFQDKNVMAQMVHHATVKPRSLAECGVSIQPSLQAVIDKLLDKKPENRFQTPDECAEALTPFLPQAAHKAEKLAVLPAYRQWLESESAFELPLDVRAAVQAMQTSMAPAPAPAAPVAPSAPTTVAPALPVAAKAAPVAPPAPPAKATPVPAKMAATKSGSAPAPALAQAPTPARPAPTEVMVNVELVPWPPPQPQQPRSRRDRDEEPVEEEKSPYELGRRDFVMMGLGAVGVLVAVGFGYALSRLTARRKDDETSVET